VPSPPNAAARRFARIQLASLAVKLAALAVLLVLVTMYLGGHL
jgi:hypothetical protein